MTNYKIKIILISVVLVVSLCLGATSFVLSVDDLDAECEWGNIEQKEKELSDEQYRELLKKCEAYYEQKTIEIGEDIEKTEQEKKSLANKIAILKNKVKSLDYQIYQSNIMVKDLGSQIEDTKSSIDQTGIKIEDIEENLIHLLRLRYEQDQISTVEILLAEASLSDFFDNLMALEALNLETQKLLKNIKDLKSNLEGQKASMDTEKEDLENLVIIQTLQKQTSAELKREREYSLELTETEYQKQLREMEETEKMASEIRARIFELIGVPEAPTFEEALQIARYVESITGVRPALLLAVLTQESNIGKNVGQCYLKNFATGEGVVAYNGREVSRVMKPDGLSGRKGDIPYFLQITKELGRDPKNTLVSCPMSYGWGGAMGPAQFIPSTWAGDRTKGSYRERVKAITGKSADPWNIKDAFLAAGLYLSDYGAVKQTYDNEFNAVLSYFAGPSWYKSSYKNIYRRDYGYPVMKLVSGYEKDIQTIEN